MSDLINRKSALKALRPIMRKSDYYYEIQKAIQDVPPAEPEQRKKGKWRHYEGYLTCSECGTEYDDDIMTHCCDDVPKFCPNCGADMRGEE